MVWHVADNGERTEMPSTYDGRDVRVTVGHFSNYVIAYDESRAAECPKDSTCPISKFSDAAATAWYHDGVHYVLENGLMQGVEDNLFEPYSSTTRAMMAQILFNMEGRPSTDHEPDYTDVYSGMWYTEAVRWASSEDIMEGYGGGLFGPDDEMTREQLVTIVYRYAGYKGVDVSELSDFTGYTDVNKIGGWALNGMRWAVGCGAVTGRTETTLNPQDTANRAEIATIIMRYCENIAGENIAS